MIIYGTRIVHVKSEQSKSLTCKSCGARGSISYNIFRKHVHFFWIPTFPLFKKGFSQCNNCNEILKPKKMTPQHKREYDRVKSSSKGPIWQFSGLILVVLLASWLSYDHDQISMKEFEYIQTPKRGDVYKYEIEKRNFSTMKVDSVSEDSVFVLPNEYDVNKIMGIHKINKPDNYSDFSFGISKSKLKEMYESGKIFAVIR
ncbi:MAG: hypothetical protein CMP67_00970 [Flavobacteriales bacterium]|nr:hypothetical protein [Flavobacteriales bacterium]